MFSELVDILGLDTTLYGDLIAVAAVLTYIILLILVGKILCFCLKKL